MLWSTVTTSLPKISAYSYSFSRENYGCEVVCSTADVGQGSIELEGLQQKAKASGTLSINCEGFEGGICVFPCLRAGAVYERKYLLGTAMARPLIARQAMVDLAEEVGADAVVHGCTGKGNDQVCFELAFFALNPDLKIVAPWREWEIKGREDAIEYAKKHNVPVPVTKKSIYSRDRNLWHISHEGDILEGPANEPKKDMFMMTVDPEDAPDKPELVDATGSVVGMKSRGLYETPGGTILFTAVRELELLTLDRETIKEKDIMAIKFAELVYAGKWFEPTRESFDAHMENSMVTTTGSVTLKLYKGLVTVTGRKSPRTLYEQDISSF